MINLKFFIQLNLSKNDTEFLIEYLFIMEKFSNSNIVEIFMKK